MFKITVAVENKRILLSPPHMGGREREYIQEALDTNWIAPVGPHVDAFEKEMASYVGARGAVAVSSGTAAIHLALILLEVSRGDSVFCSSLTFVASANPILYQGAEPVFIDSEPETWNMSPQALEAALRDRARNGKLPKAVIVVNLYGQSAKMNEILSLCNQFEVPVIEDAAESLGSSYRDQASGTFGKFGIYSFNGNKIITTSGGGMLISNDSDALFKARFLSTQARDPAPYYQHSELGFNYRMSNILAGIGRGQLEILEERVTERRLIFDCYYRELAYIPSIHFMPELKQTRSNRWLTVLTIDEKTTEATVKQVLESLARENIEARPVWKPLHMQPLFQDCAYYSNREMGSVSEQLFNTGICLPSGTNMKLEEQMKVIDRIKEVLS